MINHSKAQKATIFIDADNTLWDTDKVYAEAQLNLLANVEKITSGKAITGDRLSFVRELDQLIAEKHHAGLRYPPRLLVSAIATTLVGATPKAAAKAAWTSPSQRSASINPNQVTEIEQRFFSDLKKLPELRKGVSEGLSSLKRDGWRLVIFTEGAREKCDRLLHHYGLSEVVEQIFEGQKKVETFRRLGRLYASAYPTIVVGDQLDRDIAPAQQADLITVYFPGGFQPKWQRKNESIIPDYKIESFQQVSEIAKQVIDQFAERRRLQKQP